MQFINVPSTEEQPVTSGTKCQGCSKYNLTPFNVRTCEHRLCGACWQRSAFNLGPETNKCQVCATPTELLCFRDYKRFVAHNVHAAELIPVSARFKKTHSDNTEIDSDIERGNDALDKHEKEVFNLLFDYCLQKRYERRRHLSRQNLGNLTVPIKRARTDYQSTADRKSTKPVASIKSVTQLES